jgi:methyl-accepting chemotaxis protein
MGTKIKSGFGIVLLLLTVLAIWSFSGIGSIVGNAETVIAGNQLDSMIAQREVDHLNWAKQLTELLTNADITTLQVETDHTKCAFGKWLYGNQRLAAEKLVPSLAPLLAKIEEPHESLHQSAISIGKNFRFVDHRLGWFLREKKSDHLAWMHRLKDGLYVSQETHIDIQTDPHQCKLGRWIYADETKTMTKADPELAKLIDLLEPVHAALHASARDINRKLAMGDRPAAIDLFRHQTRDLANKTIEALDAIRDWHDGLIELDEDTKAIYAYETMPALAEVQDLLRQIRQEAKNYILSDEAMLTAARSTKTSIVTISALALGLGLALALFISRGIIRALTSTSSRMEESADHVAAAAEQISATSQSLASGASQQAASIEETSASLEEMAAMTRQTADNADRADGLMKEANQTIATANRNMSQMTESMTTITRTGEETQKIVKTIDEIAFQTNLLALNAAVEAARAGEAGAGFAVVADEVRNLALRAAEAARDTSLLIEGSVRQIKEGADLVGSTNKAFDEVAVQADKVTHLIAEIAAASTEQSQGVDQINKAVSEMDKVVQNNVATAEEAASASEEMNAQAEQMKSEVAKLNRLLKATALRNKAQTERVPSMGESYDKSTAARGKRSLDLHLDDDQTTILES